MKFLLIFLTVILSFLLLCSLGLTVLRAYNAIKYIRKKQRSGSRRKLKVDKLLIIFAGVSIVLVVLIFKCTAGIKSIDTGTDKTQEIMGPVYDAEKVEKALSTISPNCSEGTDPSNWGITWEIISKGKLVDTYKRSEKIRFGAPEEYYALEGISAFRGDNYRTGATYGTTSVTEKTITDIWSIETGSLTANYGSTSWTGSGWTGQALVVKWDTETKAHMNMYPNVSDDVVEVIYATLDGHIYFLDLETGSYTRDPVNIGMAFKGAGTIDPRGYPLMYVGAGDGNADGKRPRMFVISLIDGTILYEYGSEDEFALRKDNDTWCAYDSSPLVDAETDTLIWPGENGILYTVKLNTEYDKSAGTISISPEDVAKTRYTTARSSEDEYWLGYECSVSVIDQYAYLSENGGMFYCVDLNTMELIWAQDTKDDSNSTPVVEFDTATNEAYIYTAPSLHWTADDDGHGEISIYKLNAKDGRIVWETTYECYTVSGVSGGVQATPLLGKAGTNLEGLIIYPVARTPSVGSGILVALDTKTGKEVWRIDMNNYCWSSPVAVYDDNGIGYVVQCDSAGNVFFIDGASGEIVDTEYVGALVEASPVVYKDTVVIGTRGSRIYGLKVK